MTRFTWIAVHIVGLALLAGAVGCEEKTTSAAPPIVQMPNCDDQIRDLEDQLARAQADRDADQDRIRALQQELERIRGELAKIPETPPPGWQAVPGGAMIAIDGTVLFDSGKADLKPTAKQTLEDVARAINERYPDHDIYVVGHTDNVPIRVSGWKDNYELSAQRALSVVRYLKPYVGPTQLAAAGWGEYRPVAENSSAQTRQMNRRVEVYAMRPHGAAGSGGGAALAPPGGQ
jgi:chemotaxis protein MotB